MPTIEWVLRDDDNQIIGQQFMKKYALNLNDQSVHDIEGAVEDFKKNAWPDIELALLEAAQMTFIQDKKKIWLVMVKRRWPWRPYMAELLVTSI